MKKNIGFTMVELVIVTLLSAIIIGALMQVLSTTFMSANKGQQSLSTFQKTSELIYKMKDDLRTLIVGGEDNFHEPIITPLVHGTSNTTKLEFYKVWNIDDSGRPLGLKVTYSIIPGRRANSPFGIKRVVGSDAPKKYVMNTLRSFQIEFLNKKNEIITDPAKTINVKKVRISFATTGSELLKANITVNSPYLITKDDDYNNLWVTWRSNFLCRTYIPRSSIRIYQGGVISGTTARPLGQPQILNSEVIFTQ